MANSRIIENCRGTYAIGYNSKGQILMFDTDVDWVIARERDLVSLETPEGVKILSCVGNPKLKDFNIPKSVRSFKCDKGLIDYTTCKVKHIEINY